MVEDAPQVGYEGQQLQFHQSREQAQVAEQGSKSYYTTPRRANCPRPRSILDLRRRNVWVLATLCVILVRAVVGGSIGGSLVVQRIRVCITLENVKNIRFQNAEYFKRAKGEPETPSIPAESTNPTGLPLPSGTSLFVPSASLTAKTFSHAPVPPNAVPLLNASTLEELHSYSGRHNDCIEGSNTGNEDITAMVTYKVEQCVDACGTMTGFRRSTICDAVSFGGHKSHEYK
ncbi:hypothetical protein BKA66DRAFT_436395 [Pyrenochaeta sp. MPI-SDFR-AT-0127]|nr:hypothetical protein BKA66DRAFT_436395 [Pyrenochaeta sp. MPI-SDFR-AT-0127]